MAGRSGSRFAAEKVLRLIVVNHGGRLEMHFGNARGTHHIVSLPLPAGVALGRLICDLAESAPFLMPEPRRSAKSKKA